MDPLRKALAPGGGVSHHRRQEEGGHGLEAWGAVAVAEGRTIDDRAEAVARAEGPNPFEHTAGGPSVLTSPAPPPSLLDTSHNQFSNGGRCQQIGGFIWSAMTNGQRGDPCFRAGPPAPWGNKTLHPLHRVLEFTLGVKQFCGNPSPSPPPRFDLPPQQMPSTPPFPTPWRSWTSDSFSR